MNKIISIFKTQGSFHKSLLTSEDENEISKDGPVSIISIAKKYKLEKIIVLDDTFFSFPSLYKNCNKNNIELIFGINIIICKDRFQKNDSSLKTNNKICILMKNSESYIDILKFHNAIYTDQENLYYQFRTDYKMLQQYFTDNLFLFIPPHDSFIEKNLLYNSICVPDFGKIKPTLTFAKVGLPYEEVLNENIKNYASNNNYDLIEVQPVYYYRNNDVKNWMVKMAIENRSNFSSPELNYACSDRFSFQEFCRKINKEFII